MKNLNKYFKLCAERKSIEAALEASAPRSEKNFWLALTNAVEGNSIALASVRKDDSSADVAIVDIYADGLFAFRNNNYVTAPTEEMLNELIEWLDEE